MSARTERIERGYRSWSQEAPDTSDLPPDFEFHPPPDLPGESVYAGPDAGERFRQALRDAFGSVRVELDSISEPGEHAIAAVRIVATGRHTGVGISREEFHLWSFEGERPLSLRCFTSREEAEAAAQE